MLNLKYDYIYDNEEKQVKVIINIENEKMKNIFKTEKTFKNIENEFEGRIRAFNKLLSLVNDRQAKGIINSNGKINLYDVDNKIIQLIKGNLDIELTNTLIINSMRNEYNKLKTKNQVLLKIKHKQDIL